MKNCWRSRRMDFGQGSGGRELGELALGAEGALGRRRGGARCWHGSREGARCWSDGRGGVHCWYGGEPGYRRSRRGGTRRRSSREPRWRRGGTRWLPQGDGFVASHLATSGWWMQPRPPRMVVIAGGGRYKRLSFDRVYIPTECMKEKGMYHGKKAQDNAGSARGSAGAS